MNDEQLTPGFEHDRLTQKEAEQVISLWARLQDERVERDGLPTVQELAEGLGAPEDQIRGLLGQVRAGVDSGSVVVERRRPRIWLGVAATLVGVCLFVLLINKVGTDMFLRESVSEPVAAEIPATSIREAAIAPTAPVTEELIATPSYASRLPEGLTLRVDGLPERGEKSGGLSSEELRGDVVSALQNLFNQLPNRATVHGRPEAMTGSRVVAAMNAGVEIRDVVTYIKSEAVLGSKKKELLLPVAITMDQQLWTIIEDERLARMKELAAWVVEQSGPATFKTVVN